MFIFQTHGIFQNIKNTFLDREFTSNTENFVLLKIKGSTRIVVGYSYNLLALKQLLSLAQPNNGMKFLQQAMLLLGLWFRGYNQHFHSKLAIMALIATLYCHTFAIFFTTVYLDLKVVDFIGLEF